ncbi:MAG: hypothetical protein D6816_00885 [Bacteroidetes bacterium]|nr:MAG: hypothetical protein D6816_00885 [Bacteroidota bacterium]
MAFTTVSSIVGGAAGIRNTAADWSSVALDTSYCYPEDINIILSQEGVIAIQVVPARFATTAGGEETTLIAIGLVGVYEGGNLVGYQRKSENDDLIALFCGRFNHRGGVFMNNAKIDPGRITPPVAP